MGAQRPQDEPHPALVAEIEHALDVRRTFYTREGRRLLTVAAVLKALKRDGVVLAAPPMERPPE